MSRRDCRGAAVKPQTTGPLPVFLCGRFGSCAARQAAPVPGRAGTGLAVWGEIGSRVEGRGITSPDLRNTRSPLGERVYYSNVQRPLRQCGSGLKATYGRQALPGG